MFIPTAGTLGSLGKQSTRTDAGTVPIKVQWMLTVSPNPGKGVLGARPRPLGCLQDDTKYALTCACFPTQPLQVQTTTMCVSVSLSGSVVLGCLFAPKLHIILFQPQKNVVSHRAPTSRFGSAAARASSSPGQGQHPKHPFLPRFPLPTQLLRCGLLPRLLRFLVWGWDAFKMTLNMRGWQGDMLPSTALLPLLPAFYGGLRVIPNFWLSFPRVWLTVCPHCLQWS